MKKVLSVLVLLALLLIEISCKNRTADLDANGMPGKLVVAIYTGGDNPNGVKAAMQNLKGYLEKKTGLETDFVYATDYTAVIEALASKKAHIAYLSPFSYMLASQKHDITPMVTVGEDGGAHLYHSLIFCNAQSAIKTIDDVRARAKTLSLCFADPASTSGHLIPRAYLNTIGLNPDSAFKQVIFAGSHSASILAVATGKIDIGCSTKEYGVDILLKRQLLKPGAIRILWQSDPIVSSPIVIRNDINKDFALKIKNLYLNMAKDAPSVFQAYIKLYNTHIERLSYIPVSDTMYNGLRKIAAGVKDLKLDK